MIVCAYVFIDLITMENGIKVSPFEIEDCIKSKIPFLSNIMLIGDKRKYLTCLMTLKVRHCILNNDMIAKCIYTVCNSSEHWRSHR